MKSPLLHSTRVRRALPFAAAAFALAVPLASSAGAADQPPTPTPSYSTRILGDQPTAYYRLDDQPGSKTAADQLNAHPGTYKGAPRLGVPGLLAEQDSAIDLDGLEQSTVGQSVDIPDKNGDLAFAGRKPFSVEAWVQPRDGNDVTRRIASSEGPDGGWLLGYTSNGFVFSRYMRGSARTVTIPARGTCASEGCLVVGTYDGTTLQLVVEDLLFQTAASTTSTQQLPVNHEVSLGSLESRYRFFAGKLDEVAIYPKPLGLTTIRIHSILGESLT